MSLNEELINQKTILEQKLEHLMATNCRNVKESENKLKCLSEKLLELREENKKMKLVQYDEESMTKEKVLDAVKMSSDLERMSQEVIERVEKSINEDKKHRLNLLLEYELAELELKRQLELDKEHRISIFRQNLESYEHKLKIKQDKEKLQIKNKKEKQLQLLLESTEKQKKEIEELFSKKIKKTETQISKEHIV